MSEETIEIFEDHLSTNIKTISSQLKKGTYKLSPVRGVLIEKPGKKDKRPLRVPEVRDRLVLKAIALKVDEYLSPNYNLDNECSFAYRKNRNVESAIRKMVEYYQEGFTVILEADIEKFFDSVDRTKLLPMVYRHLPDDSLNKLIADGLSQEVANLHQSTLHAHYFDGPDECIPQGNALSPLFANVYLSSFDHRMMKEDFRMVRYADDFIVMVKTIDQAKAALLVAKEELEIKLGLKLHPLGDNPDSKTRIVYPSKHPFTFLSIRFDGHSLWVSEKKVTALKEKINAVTQSASNSNLLRVLTRMRNLLEGWLSSFKFVEVERCYKEIDDKIEVDLYKIFVQYGFYLRTSHTRTFQRDKKKLLALTRNQRVATGINTCKTFIVSLEYRGKIEIQNTKSVKRKSKSLTEPETVI